MSAVYLKKKKAALVKAVTMDEKEEEEKGQWPICPTRSSV